MFQYKPGLQYKPGSNCNSRYPNFYQGCRSGFLNNYVLRLFHKEKLKTSKSQSFWFLGFKNLKPQVKSLNFRFLKVLFFNYCVTNLIPNDIQILTAICGVHVAESLLVGRNFVSVICNIKT